MRTSLARFFVRAAGVRPSICGSLAATRPWMMSSSAGSGNHLNLFRSLHRPHASGQPLLFAACGIEVAIAVGCSGVSSSSARLPARPSPVLRGSRGTATGSVVVGGRSVLFGLRMDGMVVRVWRFVM